MATVIVYSKSSCPQCTMTKKALKKNGVIFIEETLTPDTVEKFAALGFRSAPIVTVGEETWSGFQPDRIDRLVA